VRWMVKRPRPRRDNRTIRSAVPTEETLRKEVIHGKPVTADRKEMREMILST